jgi:alkaline phosphatase
LEIEKMPVVGLVKTHAANNWITDSASGATAIATGHKTNVGMVGVTPDSVVKETIFETAIKHGMKTGLVVTSHITDATPACFVTHVPARGMKNEIAEQLIHSKVNIILGGGLSYFIPKSEDGSEREDDKNLIEEAEKLGYNFTDDTTSFAEIKEGNLIGLFNKGGLITNPPEPSLADMTQKALQLIGDSEKGFILMVEGSQIDWRGHSNDLEGVIKQTLLFDDAVKVGLDFAKENGETLILVTADHETGGITLTGDDRENDFSFGVKWATKHHTGIPVPVYAFGPHAIEFTGILDNTDIYKIVSSLLGFNSNVSIK